MRRFAALLLLALPLAAYAWWNDEWNFRKEITLDLTAAGANIAGSPADVPVLIRLHLGNFGYFADTKPDGADLRFVAGDDKTPLKFHVERYDADEQSRLRVGQGAAARRRHGDRKDLLYYGNTRRPPARMPPARTTPISRRLSLRRRKDSPKDATAYGNKPATADGEIECRVADRRRREVRRQRRDHLAGERVAARAPDKGADVFGVGPHRGTAERRVCLELADANRCVVLGINGTQAFARLTARRAGRRDAQSADVLSPGSGITSP